MAPKRTEAARRSTKVFTPTRSNPKISEETGEDATDDDEEFEPPLNQEGLNPTFDRIVSPPNSSRGKGAATTSSADSDLQAYAQTQNYLLEQQADQRDQLKQLFSLVSALGSDIRTVVKAVGKSPVISTTEEQIAEDQQSGPVDKKKGRKVAFATVPLDQEADLDLEKFDDDDDDDPEYCEPDTYVSHAYYRDIISEGFEKRAPSRQAPNKPAYFPIDDPVTRTLTASKYTAKATEYNITVANAFFASVTKAALDDAIDANNNGGDPATVAILLSQVQANMAAIEDMHRDRMLFLDLTSDPNSSATEKDYANNVLRNEFTPGVQNKGGSSRSNKIFAAYQLQFLKATQFASAKASANRHLSSSTGSGTGSSGNASGGQAANSGANSQKKKEAAAKRKAAAEKAAGAGAGAGPGAAKPKEGKKQAHDANE